MFSHRKELQYHAMPEAPNPLLAKRLQELIGGQYGELTVMNQYLFQGWNCRGPQKYKDMLLAIGTEEIGHVEMLATMVARLLEGAPVSVQEEAATDPAVGAVMGGMNPQHAIVSGLGATPTNSVGHPWSGYFVTSSGNLMADFRANLNAETNGRLQAVRIWEMTQDPGVKDMLGFLIARDAMHQRQWLAAIAELEADGLEEMVAPGTFPESQQPQAPAFQFIDLSQGGNARDGRWAKGPAPDGKGQFDYVADPAPQGDIPQLGAVDARIHGTRKTALGQMAGQVGAAVKRVVDAK